MRSMFPIFGLHGLTAWVVFALLAPVMHAVAEASDEFEGALWRFEMSNRKHPDLKFVGFFRVSEHVLYQAETPGDKKFSKRVGTNHPHGKRTRFDVHDFRVFTAKKRDIFYIKGTSRLSLVKFGEWEGMFTDGTGSDWDYRAFRIQE